ncbi:MAG: hypothetical protein Q8L55_07530 [Phycisphaerales bacterium]|nr:hypothetical protein [Phycisphaerales bacterium]
MARKLRTMFRSVTPTPGSGERPATPESNLIGPSGLPAGAVASSTAPVGESEAKGRRGNETIEKLAYERWLQTGGSAIENWVWAEAELARRGG